MATADFLAVAQAIHFCPDSDRYSVFGAESIGAGTRDGAVAK
jgi:hypothetical protein